MTDRMSLMDRDSPFGREILRYAARARRNRLCAWLVIGVFFALAAAAAYALLNDLAALPLPPPVFAAAAVALGAAAAAAAAALSPLDPLPLLIRADKALATGELSSTAYGLIGGKGESIFRAAIIEDAARSLGGGDPAAVIGRPRMRLLPFLPAVLLGAVLLCAFPFDLKAILTPPPRLDPEIVRLGEDLESFGKKLEKKAEEEGLARSLALSEELQKIGEDFQNQTVDQSEALRRLADIEDRVAEEYGLRIRRFEEPGEGSESGDGGTPGEENEEAMSGALDRSSPGGEPGGQADQETQDFADALDMLSEKRKGLGGNSPPGTDAEDPGAAGRKGRGAAGGMSDEGTEGPSLGEDDGQLANRKPGTMPADVKHGEASDIQLAESGESLKAEVPMGEGDSKSFMLRALPRRNDATIPEKELLGSYEKTAESALAGEEIPLELREYVKQYFISLGLLGAEK